jgi:hypothetical protein
MKKVKVKTKQKQKQKQTQIVNINLGKILKKSQGKRKSQPKQFNSSLSSGGPSISFNAPPIREYVDTSLNNRPSPGDNQLVVKNTPTTTQSSMGQWSQIENNNPLTNQQPQQKSLGYKFGQYLINSNISDDEFNRQMNYRQIGYISQQQAELDKQKEELQKKQNKEEAIKAATTPQKKRGPRGPYKTKSRQELPSIQESNQIEELPSTQELNPPTNPLLSEPVGPPTITSEPVPNPNIISGIETDAQRAERILQENRRKKEERKAFLESQNKKPIDEKKNNYLNAASPGRNRIIDEPNIEQTLTDEPTQPPGISEGLGQPEPVQPEPEVKKKTKGPNKKKTAVI